MKKRSTLVILLVLASILLAACQGGGGPEATSPGDATQPPATQAPADGAAYPAPDGGSGVSYPAPLDSASPEMDANAAGPDGTYPGIADGSEISWGQVYGLITAGAVQQAVISANGVVTLNLVDGRSLTSQGIDAQAVQVAVDNCTVCEDLEIVKE